MPSGLWTRQEIVAELGGMNLCANTPGVCAEIDAVNQLSAEQDHDQPGGLVGAPWPFLPFEKESELAAQEEILRYELLMGAEEAQVLDRKGDG